MLTKLNRVLLASGLAAASAALLSPSAFASGGAIVTGTVQPYTNIAVTPGGNSFDVTWNTAATDKPIATVDFATNVVGVWTIKAESTNAGKLTTSLPGGSTAQIPYTVALGGGTPATPGATGSASLLASGTVSNEILEATTISLYINITAANTKVPTVPAKSAYTDTVTLVFTSGQ